MGSWRAVSWSMVMLVNVYVKVCLLVHLRWLLTSFTYHVVAVGAPPLLRLRYHAYGPFVDLRCERGRSILHVHSPRSASNKVVEDMCELDRVGIKRSFISCRSTLDANVGGVQVQYHHHIISHRGENRTYCLNGSPLSLTPFPSLSLLPSSALFCAAFP